MTACGSLIFYQYGSRPGNEARAVSTITSGHGHGASNREAGVLFFVFKAMGKKRIRGTVIHKCRDEFGEVIVADDRGRRFLYFSDGALQSGILLEDPQNLIVEYNQAMMSALLFKEDPMSALMIGLGGGSLVNFLLRAFPECVIDVVEIRRLIIEIAHDYFLLPRDDARLTIAHASGEDFILNSGEEGRCYDLILVDAFDDDGPARASLEKDFVSACRQRLNKEGIFVMNVWSRPEDKLGSLYAMIRRVFANASLKILLGEAYQNALLFGFDNGGTIQDLIGYRARAKDLRRRYGVNFPKYLKYLYWQNTV